MSTPSAHDVQTSLRANVLKTRVEDLVHFDLDDHTQDRIVTCLLEMMGEMTSFGCKAIGVVEAVFNETEISDMVGEVTVVQMALGVLHRMKTWPDPEKTFHVQMYIDTLIDCVDTIYLSNH